MNQKHSYCYIAFVHGGEPAHKIIKIGHSQNPVNRLRELQTMGWDAPRIMEATSRNTAASGKNIEWFMHDCLRRYRLHGEWFHVPNHEIVQAKEGVWDKYGETFDYIDLGEDADAAWALRSLCWPPQPDAHGAGWYFPSEWPPGYGPGASPLNILNPN